MVRPEKGEPAVDVRNKDTGVSTKSKWNMTRKKI